MIENAYLITLSEEINNALFFVDPFGLSCSQFKSLYRRIANVFLKGYVTKQTDDIALQKKRKYFSGTQEIRCINK